MKDSKNCRQNQTNFFPNYKKLPYQINQHTIDYEDTQNDVKSQVGARMKIENKLSDLTKACLELKNMNLSV